MELEEAHQEEVSLPEEALPEEVLQEEVLLEDAHQEEALQEEDLPGEDNHQRSKPKWHNQDPNKPDHDMNPFVEQRSRNSEETELTPKSS